MRLRLTELLGPDRESRWRIIFISAFGIAASGMISQGVGFSFHEAQIGATIFGTVIFALQAFFYCVRRHLNK